MTFEYSRDTNGIWHWRLKTADQRIVAVSSEEYTDEDDCTDGIMIVKRCRDARLVRVENA